MAKESFTDANYNNYANNFKFLSVILANGTNLQKGYIVKILIGKIDENKEIKQVLDLIDSMDDVKSFDDSNLLQSHLKEYLKQNKQELDDTLKTRIKQLIEKIKK